MMIDDVRQLVRADLRASSATPEDSNPLSPKRLH